MNCMMRKDRTEIYALIGESLAEGVRLAEESHRAIWSMLALGRAHAMKNIGHWEVDSFFNPPPY